MRASSPTAAESAATATETLEQALRREQDRLEALEDRWLRGTSDRDADPDALSKAITVHLEGDLDAGSRLEVSYFVPAARWTPAYRLEFPDVGLERCTLRMRALVAQDTGEDWADVRLRLSTARPQRWTDLAELPSLRIGRAQPQPRSGWRAPPADTAHLFDDYTQALSVDDGAVAGGSAVLYGGGGRRDECRGAGRRRGGTTGRHAGSRGARPHGCGGQERRHEPSVRRELALSDEVTEGTEGGVKSLTRAGSVDSSKLAEYIDDLAPDRQEEAEALRQYAAAFGHALPDGPTAGGAGATLVATSAQLDYGRLRMIAPPNMMAGELAVHDEAGHGGRPVMVDTSRLASLTADWPHDYDYAYEAEASVSVDSDGAAHGIGILGAECASAAQYVVVPRESRDVFREASLVNPLPGPILAGPVDVMIGRDFLLTDQLPSRRRVQP